LTCFSTVSRSREMPQSLVISVPAATGIRVGRAATGDGDGMRGAGAGRCAQPAAATNVSATVQQRPTSCLKSCMPRS
jgi:hypothetical protein